MGYITEDLNPERVEDLVESLYEVTGEEDAGAADADAVVAYAIKIREWVEQIAKPAAEGLIEVHKATGIDLKHWEPVLRFVQSVSPTFSIEGEPEF